MQIIISIILFLAGFSQINIGFFGLADIFIMLLLFCLLFITKFKIKLVHFFIYFSIFYAFIIGEFSKPMQVITLTISYISLFLLIKYFKDKNESQIAQILSFFNYGMFISNIVVISFLFLLPNYRNYIIDISSTGFRLKGFFEQANGYAFVLLINVPIAAYFFFTSKKFFNFFILSTAILVFIFTQSRGALFGLILSLIIIYLSYIISHNPLKRLQKLLLPSFILIITFLAIMNFLPEYIENNFGLNLSRINPMREAAHERNISEFSYTDLQKDRFFLLSAAFNTLSKYPLGLGYQEQHLIIGKETGVYLIPHNYFINLLLNYGVLLGLIWNIIIAYIIYKGYKYFRINRISPKNLFFYLHFMMLSVVFYYFTHSVEWFHFYVFIAIYCSYIFHHKIDFNHEPTHN